MSEQESEIAELRKQYGSYVVEPNIEAIERLKKRYSRLFGNPAYAKKLYDLSNEVYHYFVTNIETAVEHQNKMYSMERVRQVIMKYRDWRFELWPLGSTVTGLATKGSDLDMVIWCPDAKNIFSNAEEAAFHILRLVRHFLLIDPSIRDDLNVVYYVEAKVPILKIKFKNGLSIDLGCCVQSYVSGVRNSCLIGGLTLWDPRFAPLCILIKKWATCHGVKNSTNGGFNSYAIVLLVIHFLQCVACPPILPNLPKLLPDDKHERNVMRKFLFSLISNITEEHLSDVREGKSCPPMPNFQKLLPVAKENGQSLAELFVLFLDYYSNFDFELNYICMRDASVKRRKRQSGASTLDTWNSVYIRDPIDDHNPGRTVQNVEYLQVGMRSTLRLFTSVERFPTLSQLLSVE